MAPEASAAARDRRRDAANELIQIIARHGRRFFRNGPVVAMLLTDARGRVWFFDDYSHAMVFTHYRGRWQKFTHGGTLKRLVEALRDYIQGRARLPLDHIGPWPDWVCGGDLWGYGAAAMEAVRTEARELAGRAP